MASLTNIHLPRPCPALLQQTSTHFTVDGRLTVDQALPEIRTFQSRQQTRASQSFGLSVYFPVHSHLSTCAYYRILAT